MSILGIGWPCMTQGCDKPGAHTVTIAYGPDGDVTAVGLRLCRPHLDHFVAWFGDGAVLHSKVTEDNRKLGRKRKAKP